MASFKIEGTVHGKKGEREKGLLARVQKALTKVDEFAHVSLKKEAGIGSRADRLNEALSMIDDARGEVESIKEELQSWLDNLPVNLQIGSKAEEIQSAIDELDQIIEEIQTPDGSCVSFPSMF